MIKVKRIEEYWYQLLKLRLRLHNKSEKLPQILEFAVDQPNRPASFANSLSCPSHTVLNTTLAKNMPVTSDR